MAKVKTDKSTKELHKEILGMVNQNEGKLGKEFLKVFKNGLKDNQIPVFCYFLRSNAYPKSNIKKLIQLAVDIKYANEAWIKFIDKYTPELFLSKAADFERSQIDFINNKILPILKKSIF